LNLPAPQEAENQKKRAGRDFDGFSRSASLFRKKETHMIISSHWRSLCGVFLGGLIVGSGLTYALLRRPPSAVSAATVALVSPEASSAPTAPRSSTQPKSSLFDQESKDADPSLISSLSQAADQWAQSQKNTISQAFNETLQQQKDETLTHWVPTLSTHLKLTDEQKEALANLIQTQGPAALSAHLASALALSEAQESQWQSWQQERQNTRAEAAAQRTLTQLSENLPLTSTQKDQVWSLLSAEALQSENMDSSSPETATQRQQTLREKLTHILGPSTVPIIDKALPSLTPPADEFIGDK
jgi:hypothetical protein